MVASTGKVADRLRELSKSQLERDDSGPRRIYRGRDGFEYYSVTSILSATAAPEKQAALKKWLEMPGAEQSRQSAAERGTRAHANAEYILKTGRKLAYNAARKRNVWTPSDDGLERCPKDITSWALNKAASSAPRVSWSAAGHARGLRHFLLDRITAVHGAELKGLRSICSSSWNVSTALADVDGKLGAGRLEDLFASSVKNPCSRTINVKQLHIPQAFTPRHWY